MEVQETKCHLSRIISNRAKFNEFIDSSPKPDDVAKDNDRKPYANDWNPGRWKLMMENNPEMIRNRWNPIWQKWWRIILKWRKKIANNDVDKIVEKFRSRKMLIAKNARHKEMQRDIERRRLMQKMKENLKWWRVDGGKWNGITLKWKRTMMGEMKNKERRFPKK